MNIEANIRKILFLSQFSAMSVAWLS